MSNVIDFSEFQPKKSPHCDELSLISDYDTQRIERVRDYIEESLEKLTIAEDLPLTVAMSAGRFAAMRMFQLQGRSETMAFIDQCITTAELCDDLAKQLDEDA
jgi:hypothetical protein